MRAGAVENYQQRRLLDGAQLHPQNNTLCCVESRCQGSGGGVRAGTVAVLWRGVCVSWMTTAGGDDKQERRKALMTVAEQEISALERKEEAETGGAT